MIIYSLPPLPSTINSTMEDGTVHDDPPPPLFERLSRVKKPNKLVYDILTEDSKNSLQKYRNRWSQVNVRFDEADYQSAFVNLRTTTFNSKFRDFQYQHQTNMQKQ